MSEAGFDGDLGSGILSSASQRQPVQRGDYTQTLADHDLLASVGSVGEAYDNALADSFLDSFKTELITDRIWRRARSSSSPSSTTSAGSTTSRYTNRAATSPRSSTNSTTSTSTPQPRCARPTGSLRETAAANQEQLLRSRPRA